MNRPATEAEKREHAEYDAYYEKAHVGENPVEVKCLSCGHHYTSGSTRDNLGSSYQPYYDIYLWEDTCPECGSKKVEII